MICYPKFVTVLVVTSYCHAPVSPWNWNLRCTKIGDTVLPLRCEFRAHLNCCLNNLKFKMLLSGACMEQCKLFKTVLSVGTISKLEVPPLRRKENLVLVVHVVVNWVFHQSFFTAAFYGGGRGGEPSRCCGDWMSQFAVSSLLKLNCWWKGFIKFCFMATA